MGEGEYDVIPSGCDWRLVRRILLRAQYFGLEEFVDYYKATACLNSEDIREDEGDKTRDSGVDRIVGLTDDNDDSAVFSSEMVAEGLGEKVMYNSIPPLTPSRSSNTLSPPSTLHPQPDRRHPPSCRPKLHRPLRFDL